MLRYGGKWQRAKGQTPLPGHCAKHRAFADAAQAWSLGLMYRVGPAGTRCERARHWACFSTTAPQATGIEPAACANGVGERLLAGRVR